MSQAYHSHRGSAVDRPLPPHWHPPVLWSNHDSRLGAVPLHVAVQKFQQGSAPQQLTKHQHGLKAWSEHEWLALVTKWGWALPSEEKPTCLQGSNSAVLFFAPLATRCICASNFCVWRSAASRRTRCQPRSSRGMSSRILSTQEPECRSWNVKRRMQLQAGLLARATS